MLVLKVSKFLSPSLKIGFSKLKPNILNKMASAGLKPPPSAVKPTLNPFAPNPKIN